LVQRVFIIVVVLGRKGRIEDEDENEEE